eukprot:TRINITY_DN9341_c0_g1_i1.p1 TRINITY_DN9341_c0_g1~~TRINITY_DN9341_c0_g1_i1.p1  ORF type:complete len:449 (+),score=132.15 TRINITY_DN9341_c0_g1_i1:66-1412(+)
MDDTECTVWRECRKVLFHTDEERAVLQRYRDLKHRMKFPGLPAEARIRVLQFFSVYGEDWIQDLETMEALLMFGADDLRHYDSHAAVLQRIGALNRTLEEEHIMRFGDFALYARALGLDASSVHLPERELVSRAIAKVRDRANEQLARWRFVSEWAIWYDEQVYRPCRDLRLTLRPQLRRYAVRTREFAERWDDAVAARLLSEQDFLESKLTDIESLGSPSLSKKDLKNMFWQLGLPFDDSVTEEYPASVTFHQAYTLGLFDTTHIRSFSWEDRQPAVTEDACDRALREDAEKAASERRQKERDERARATAERLRREVESMLEQAREAACRRMDERLWVAAERARMPYLHRHAGCELFNTVNVHWVAVPLRDGATDDLVLCEKGASEYEQYPLIHKQYLWLYIRDLVDGVYDSMPTVQSIAADVRARHPDRAFNKEIAERRPASPSQQ